jgi:hypothetical protein
MIFQSIRARARIVALAGLAGAAAAALALAPAPANAATSSSVAAYPQEKRYLDGFWANEKVPSYKCPMERPYLEDWNYAPPGTTLPRGVEIKQARTPWPIGVSITGVKGIQGDLTYAHGTPSHLLTSSATNWTTGREWYQVVLHCTSDKSQSYVVLRSE